MSDREDFEEAASRLGYNLTMSEHETGEYHYQVTQDAWDIWQEATYAAAREQEDGKVVYQLKSKFGGGWDDVSEDEYSCAHESYVRRALYTRPHQSQGVPEGYVLAPKSMCITQEDVGFIAMMTGWDDEDQDDAEGVLWFGLIEDDEGNRTHGLNISCSECMEEGAIQSSWQ